MAAGLLPAVGGPGVQAGVALATDHLVGVVLHGQDAQGGLDDAAAETQHQVEGGLCGKGKNKTQFSKLQFSKKKK